MDRPPGQLLSAGKLYCTLALYRRGLYVTVYFPSSAPLRLGVIHVLMKSSIKLGRLPHFGWLRVCPQIHFFLRVLTGLQRHGYF